jgi:RecB family endonuclease NucS
MDRVTLFTEPATGACPLLPRPFANEADLRRFVERRLESVLGLRLVAVEVAVDGWTAGRIDVLAVDDRHRPVVVEFKRTASGLAIGQALVYLDWVLAHRDAVALLVARHLGILEADRLEWSGSRLLCIAEDIEPREEAVARQLRGKVELVRIVRYKEGIFVIQRT